jgi:hypothetical protein
MKYPTLGWYIRHDDSVRLTRELNGVPVPPPCDCGSGEPGECWRRNA